MSDQGIPSPRPLRRRHFLRAFGLALGGLSIERSVLAATRRSETALDAKSGLDRLPTIGILLPNSERYPSFSSHLQIGLELALRKANMLRESGNRSLKVVAINRESGGLLGAAKRLILEEDVDLLIGAVNITLAHQLHELLEAQGRCLIVADTGADILRSSEQSPFIFHNSLGYWRSSWALGDWAGRRVGKTAFVAASHYESGFDALYAFQCGLNRIGGSVDQTCVSHVGPGDPGLDAMMAAIDAVQPDFVYAAYCGQEAKEFLAAYKAAGFGERFPLLCSSFMFDDSTLQTLGPDDLGIIDCQAWGTSLGSGETGSFSAAFEKRTGHTVDVFANLGFETGRLVAEISRAVGGNFRQTDSVRSAFRAARRDGLHKLSQADQSGSSDSTTMYIRKVCRDGLRIGHQTVETVNARPDSDYALHELRREVRSGWLNTYLC